MKNNDYLSEPPDFSLFLGGPLFQLLMRLRLTTPALELLKKRIICLTLFAWLPLMILSLIDGKAWGGVRVPFLYDMEAQCRFLLALPLLIAAELLVHMRLYKIVRQFVDQNIITEKNFPKFRELITSAMRLRNSVAIELILLMLAFVVGHYIWNIISVIEKLASGTGTWYATGTHLTLAGYWYFFVSRPLFQFILFRWYFRIFIWIRFLWQTSRLELNLIPTHPDHAGGLGFLALSVGTFFTLMAAHGALLAGVIANSIFFTGEKLTDSTLLISAVIFFLLTIILGPLLVFSPHLMRIKRNGFFEYGTLASRYVSAFDFKWLRKQSSEPLIGSPDIQSLADMSNSFQIIRDIQLFPFRKDAVIQVIVFTLIPVFPLVLTMVPLEDLIRKLIVAIF